MNKKKLYNEIEMILNKYETKKEIVINLNKLMIMNQYEISKAYQYIIQFKKKKLFGLSSDIINVEIDHYSGEYTIDDIKSSK